MGHAATAASAACNATDDKMSMSERVCVKAAIALCEWGTLRPLHLLPAHGLFIGSVSKQVDADAE
jgi:hypothetical protein